MSKKTDPMSLSAEERRLHNEDCERRALAADEARKEYTRNPPTMDELVEEVVSILRSRETDARTRLDQRFPKGNRARAAALYLHRKVEDDLCESPQRGGTLRTIEHGLHARWPGIPLGDIKEAVAEAQNRGLIRFERAAFKHSFGGPPVAEDVYRVAEGRQLAETDQVNGCGIPVTDDCRVRHLAESLLAVVNAGHVLQAMWEVHNTNEDRRGTTFCRDGKGKPVGSFAVFLNALDAAIAAVPGVNATIKRYAPTWPDLWTSDLSRLLRETKGTTQVTFGGRILDAAWFVGQLDAIRDRGEQLRSLDLSGGAVPAAQPESAGRQNADAIPARLRKAVGQYQQAADATSETKLTDKDAYDWLHKAHRREGAADELPDFNTWSRYLREYRRLTNGQKNKPRRGRSGRSIRHHSQL